MKKILIIFILLFSLKAANAQLEFYQFMLNIYSSGERIADTRTFDVNMNIYDRKNPNEILRTHHLTPGDTAKNLGYDYNILQSGDLFFNRTGELIITQGADTMKIIFDNPKASAWTSVGLDKVEFRKGKFLFDEEHWPKNIRDRAFNNRNFLFVEDTYDWEKIRK